MHDDVATVVVPCFNAASTLGAQLDALARQTFSGPLHVVVADNGSTDDTIEVANRHRPNFASLCVVDASDRKGPAHARNVGISHTTTELVLGCDADDVADERWAELLIGSLRDSDLVAGGMLPWDGGMLRAGDPSAIGGAGLGYLPACNGASFGIRRPAWEAVGGFDESLTTGEDIDLAWRVGLAGLRVADGHRAYVHYRVPMSTGAILRKWYGYGHIQPELFRRYRSSGMRRRPSYRALGRWIVLALTAYHLIDPADRVVWARDVGRRAGRLVGSIRAGVWYL